MSVEIRIDEDLHELLAGLGKSHADVARTLAQADIRGAREDATCCPVAKWLLLETNADEVEVDLSAVTVRFPAGTIRTTPPLPVSQFISKFDDFEYPELDEDDEWAGP